MLYLTAQDLQDTLVRMTGGKADQETVLDIRRAIRQALWDVSSSHQWPYYHDYYHLLADAPYTTGTVTYTASTRRLTISGGTWPSWAAYGVIILDTKHARLESRTSATVATVSAADAPADDYSGSFTLYRYQFELDHTLNLYKFGRLLVDQTAVLDYVPPDLFETDARRSHLTSGGRPRQFTVSRGPTIGRTTLSIWPWPSEAMRFRFGYLRHPRDIKVWEYDTGVVTTTETSSTVAGTDTSWTSDHVNCLLRIGSNRNAAPTSRDGRNPPLAEVLVRSVQSATTLVTASEVLASTQNVAHTLSDVLDLDVQACTVAVIYGARRQLAMLRNEDPKAMAVIDRAYREALYNAKATCSGDNTVEQAGRFGTRHPLYPGLWDSYYTLGS